MSCEKCSLPCQRDGVECVQCKNWFHYGCTDLPAYFIVHLEEIADFDYICEVCVLKAYDNCHAHIGNIEKSINDQKLLGISPDKSESGDSDSNEEIDVDQNVLNADLNRDENKNKPPTVPQGTGTQTDGNQNNGQKNSELDKDGNKIKTVSRYYSAGKCRHGRVGSDCRFSHPNMCRKYIKNGYNNNNGCTRGANCKFFHTKLCHDSVDFFQCDKVYCNYYHLVGTPRPNFGNSTKNNVEISDSQHQNNSDGVNDNHVDFSSDNNTGNQVNHRNTQQSGEQNQNNIADSGAQVNEQHHVVHNNYTGQQINEALNSFLGYIKQLDKKMCRMEAQYNQCMQFKPWGPQPTRWFQPQMNNQAYNLA